MNTFIQRQTPAAAPTLPGINPPPVADLGDVALMRLPDVRRVFPVSASTWYALVRQGIAPAPVKLGTGSFWRASEVRAFLARDPAEISAALKATRQLRATRGSA